MNKLSKGVFYQIDIENLGEFRFLFHDKGKLTETKNHYLEVYWNPSNYGLVDFLVGYDVEDIDKEIAEFQEDMSYFIDSARISCICRIEDGSDNEGVYEGILNSYFDEEYCDCENCPCKCKD